MGPSDKLRRLDEKMGFGPPSPERWRRWLRLWWVNLAFGAFLLVFAQIAELAWDVEFPPISFAGIVIPIFQSGFLYAQRLRQLNRKGAFPAFQIPDEAVGDPKVASEVKPVPSVRV